MAGLFAASRLAAEAATANPRSTILILITFTLTQ